MIFVFSYSYLKFYEKVACQKNTKKTITQSKHSYVWHELYIDWSGRYAKWSMFYVRVSQVRLRYSEKKSKNKANKKNEKWYSSVGHITDLFS